MIFENTVSCFHKHAASYNIILFINEIICFFYKNKESHFNKCTSLYNIIFTSIRKIILYIELSRNIYTSSHIIRNTFSCITRIFVCYILLFVLLHNDK